MKPSSLRSFLSEAVNALREAGVDSPEVDARLLAALWEENGNKVIQRIPYPGAEALQLVMDEVAARKPEAKKLKASDLIDGRFVKELEESGFIKTLYGDK